MENTRKVHVSFCSLDAMELVNIQSGVQYAGYICTVVHIRQTEDWFTEWSEKCQQANFIVVMFTDKYRHRFTEPLQREARFIDRCHRELGIPVYIYDNSVGMTASEVQVNLQNGVQRMGEYQTWYNFVQNTQPVDGHDYDLSQGNVEKNFVHNGTANSKYTASAPHVGGIHGVNIRYTCIDGPGLLIEHTNGSQYNGYWQKASESIPGPDGETYDIVIHYADQLRKDFFNLKSGSGIHTYNNTKFCDVTITT